MDKKDITRLINIMKPHLEHKRKRKRTNVDMDELLSLKMVGMSDTKCADYFNVSPSTIYRRVKELKKAGKL